MDPIHSLYDLLASPFFRQQPETYLGKASIIHLRLFINGYKACEAFQGSNTPESPPFWLFPYWVTKGQADPPAWEQAILDQQQMDEGAAFHHFFTLFDQFKTIVPVVVKTALIGLEEHEQFQAYQKQLGLQQSAATPDQLYVVRYSQGFGYTLHQIGNDQPPQYFSTHDTATQASQQLFGNALAWEDVTGQDLSIT